MILISMRKYIFSVFFLLIVGSVLSQSHYILNTDLSVSILWPRFSLETGSTG